MEVFDDEIVELIGFFGVDDDGVGVVVIDGGYVVDVNLGELGVW